MDDTGIIARVRATTRAPQYGEVETPVVTYELQQSEQVVDLKWHEDYADLTRAENGLIDKAIDDKMTNDEFTTEWNDKVAVTDSGVSAANKTKAEALLYRKRRGQDNFLIYGWLFTRNLSVSIYYPTQINFANHGLRWSNDQVNRYCGSLPNFVLPAFTAQQEQTDAGLDYAWLQTQSSVQISNKGGFNLTEGWTHALWDTTVYGASTY
jgi:hypothetical protein